jgi:hypothetical protein
MLNLNRQEQALTQGQSQGKRVVARAVQVDEIVAQTEQSANSPLGTSSQPAGPADPVGMDAQAIARRVYEMMRQDLRVDRERRKPGG